MAKIIWREPKQERRDDGQSVGGEQKRRGSVSVVAPTAKAEKDDELEVKNDEAWFAAELAWRDGMVAIHFADYSDDEDENWDAEKMKSLKPLRDHIRVVSAQLQDAECRLVSVNKVVCALRKSEGKEGWYDATVTEVTRRDHTFENGEEICTCAFTVIWRHGPAKGRLGRDLTCGDICIPSNKDVETHPLIVDILIHVLREGATEHHEEENRSPSKHELEGGDGGIDENPTCSDEVEAACRFKRLKSKIMSVNLVKTEVYPDPDPDKGRLKVSEPGGKAKDRSSSTSVDTDPQGLLRSRSIEEKESSKSIGLSTNKDCKDQEQRETFISPLAAALQDHHLQWKSSPTVDIGDGAGLSPVTDACFRSSQQSLGFVTCELGDFQEYGHHSLAKVEPTADVSTKRKRPETVDCTGEAQQSKKVRITLGIDIELGPSSPMPEDPRGSLNKMCAAPKVTALSSKCEEIFVSAGKPCEEQKVKASVSKAEDFSHLVDDKFSAGPRVKACVSVTCEDVAESFDKSEKISADACGERLVPVGRMRGSMSRFKERLGPHHKYFGQPKVNQSALQVGENHCKRGTGSSRVRCNQDAMDSKYWAEERLGPHHKYFGQPKVNQSAPQLGENHCKRGTGSSRIRCNQDAMDSKYWAEVKDAAKAVIDLSDDEDCGVADIKPSTSITGFSNPQFEAPDDEKEKKGEGNALLLNQSRNRSTFVKHRLGKPGCVLLIDNLETDVHPTDVLEQLLKFCGSDKIQSVQILPHPHMNHAVGYAVFVDKEAADTTAAFIARYFIVSTRGRPWVVGRWGQEEFDSHRTSTFKGEPKDGSAGSAGGFKVVTDKQLSEFNAAKRRHRVFVQHRKQSRIIFQRHSKEEKELESMPDQCLYH